MTEIKNPDQRPQLSGSLLGAGHEYLGRAVTKIISDYARSLDELPVTSDATPNDLEKIFDEPLPAQGLGVDEILARFESDVAPHAMQIPSPRYYGLFNPTPRSEEHTSELQSQSNLVCRLLLEKT